MSDTAEYLQFDPGATLSEASEEIMQIETSLAEGEFTPDEAVTEMFDIYWSNVAGGMNDEEKTALQTLIFEHAKATGMDFKEVLERWQKIAEKEQN